MFWADYFYDLFVLWSPDVKKVIPKVWLGICFQLAITVFIKHFDICLFKCLYGNPSPNFL